MAQGPRRALYYRCSSPCLARCLLPLAQSLGIPLDHVFANTILFDVRACGTGLAGMHVA